MNMKSYNNNNTLTLKKAGRRQNGENGEREIIEFYVKLS